MLNAAFLCATILLLTFSNRIKCDNAVTDDQESNRFVVPFFRACATGFAKLGSSKMAIHDFSSRKNYLNMKSKVICMIGLLCKVQENNLLCEVHS